MKEYKVTIDENGTIRYFKPGSSTLHREDGPAVEYSDGTKSWYQNGKLNRTDGPAIEYSNGRKSWYQNGECHRLDGPAMEWSNGYKAWYIHGKELTEKEFNNQNKTELTLDQIAEKFGINVNQLKIKK